MDAGTRRAEGRSLADFGGPDGLKPAEHTLWDESRRGGVARIGDSRPEAATEANTVRAGFLRFLALGGDEQSPVHENGVRLYGAWIEGDLDLGQCHLPRQLECRSCQLPGSVTLRDGRCDFGIVFDGSRVRAIHGERVRVHGNLSLRAVGKARFEAAGSVMLIGASIGGALACSGGKFEATEGAALSCDGIDVQGDVFLHALDQETRFEARGEVRLLGAKIGGDLSCVGSRFEATEGYALSCDRIDVNGSVFLEALDKKTRLEAKGEVRLLNGRIGSILSCIGGRFEATEGNALSCDGIDVKGDVFLRARDKETRFEAKGEVLLLGAKIGGNLECIGGRFEITDPEDYVILADGMRVVGAFFFRPVLAKTNNVSLSGASVARLVDDLDAWGERLVLDGFEYGRLAGRASTHAKDRLAWLDRQVPEHRARRGDGDGAGFRPQPWQHLQRVLREMGHFEDAREVAIAFEDRLRDADRIGQPPRGLWPLVARPYRWVARLFHIAFRGLTGYGYRPMRLLAWMLGIWLTCAVWYWYAASQLAVFGPTDPLVFQNPAYLVELPAATAPSGDAGAVPPAAPPTQKVMAGGNWYLFSDLPEEHTTFSPLTYSLDVILPLVDLRQEQDWAPRVPTPKPGFVEELLHFESRWRHVTRLVLWVETLFGWIASLLLVAIVSGLTRRRET